MPEKAPQPSRPRPFRAPAGAPAGARAGARKNEAPAFHLIHSLVFSFLKEMHLNFSGTGTGTGRGTELVGHEKVMHQARLHSKAP